MIEPVRIVAIGKIKTTIDTVKNNIRFWNDLHHLGLSEFREKAIAATWNIANAVIAIRELEANVTEIYLLVARRQVHYQWFYGFQPDAAARASWNRLVILWPREIVDTTYRPLDILSPHVRPDIEEFAWREGMSEYYVAATLGDAIEARYGKPKDNQSLNLYRIKIQEEIEQAKVFKREQDALQDLTPNQLADLFFDIILPSSLLPIKSTESSPKDPVTLQQADVVLEDKPTEPLRRGGPLPMPDSDKEKIVKDWLAAQGKETQEGFCNRKGVATSTLRAWIRALRAKNRLSSS